MEGDTQSLYLKPAGSGGAFLTTHPLSPSVLQLRSSLCVSGEEDTREQEGGLGIQYLDHRAVYSVVYVSQ